MKQPLPEVRALARALLETEGGGRSPEERVSAGERILHTLALRLSPLVGVGGFHLLLLRAHKRAQNAHVWLAAVRVERDAPDLLSGAAEAARQVAPEEVTVAMESVLAELIGLITRFLGADFTIGLVRQCLRKQTHERMGWGYEETSDE
jgi:hypothetical protein